MLLQMYSCDSTSPRRPDSDSLNFSLPPSNSIEVSAITASAAE
jgi:hypothetical protein